MPPERNVLLDAVRLRLRSLSLEATTPASCISGAGGGGGGGEGAEPEQVKTAAPVIIFMFNSPSLMGCSRHVQRPS